MCAIGLFQIRLSIFFYFLLSSGTNRRRTVFYKAFTNCDALRHELSWTHYRLLLRVENQDARNWYMKEAAAENWSSRQLFASKYLLYLPTEDELKKEIERERKLLDEVSAK